MVAGHVPHEPRSSQDRSGPVMSSCPHCMRLPGPPWRNTTDWVAQTAGIHFLSVLEPGVQARGADRVGSPEDSAGLASGRPLAPSLWGHPSGHMHPRVPLSSLLRARVRLDYAPPPHSQFNVIISLKAASPRSHPEVLGLGLQYRDLLGGRRSSGHKGQALTEPSRSE